ncbi:hypothetical protein JMY81_07180 [Brenneria goodwinii]|uniref:hypothetical protein n=1 Tax=Brenneria goodwinii TaxID=1109412 RepID=UPI000EF19918|nr:hypothetical protein [Brenneria goodwinii]MCG8155787.1 hypothetical protein [Brenneria goodwinii]MCG8160619.1 hypothetical protein [Brenneria goodwinii]MCG8166943.1 hypothetical protein [Brenneria goodwinii]MCG8172612.1 hypothetical protein [Brenneria goodwinii]MCG8177324.1 hypothetical protein [Brenneria goodwinii]
MRKSLKILSGIIIVVAVALTYTWPYVKMEFAGSAHYTEQDKREYEFYTPDILKKMPRISARYSFDFANITGPAAHVYAVKFYDTKETSKIEDYLASIGYKQDKCDFESVCWRGSDPQESVYVDILNDEKTVIVQVVYNFT